MKIGDIVKVRYICEYRFSVDDDVENKRNTEVYKTRRAVVVGITPKLVAVKLIAGKTIGYLGEYVVSFLRQDIEEQRVKMWKIEKELV